MNSVAFKNMNAIFLALPTALAILKPDGPDFTVEGVNDAFISLTERDSKDWVAQPFFETMRKYSSKRFENIISELESSVRNVLSKREAIETNIFEIDLNLNPSPKTKNLSLQVKCSPVLNDGESVDTIILGLYDVTNFLSKKEISKSGTQRIKSRKELQYFHQDLAAQAAHNKAQYESASLELDDFVYAVSHDLQAPLRRIDGFSQELLNEYVEKLDETGIHYLKRIRQSAQDMGQLIDDLLKLSRISRKSVDRDEINLGKMAKEVFEELMELEPGREVIFQVDDNLSVEADRGLIKAMLGNLISNALKFTSKKEVAEIKIGSSMIDGDKIFYISDNGVGFDSAYSHKLFKAFSRLHSHHQFSGTGVGLATVKRIITLHGGTIWAESPAGEGATFFFKF